jgi:hypothetical protein
LGGRLLAGDDEIDVVTAAQAMICDRQQAVGVRRQVDADDLGFLVDDVVNKPGVLMAEAVGLLEQRVVVEIDLADGQVVGWPPIRIHQCPLFVRQRGCHHRLL